MADVYFHTIKCNNVECLMQLRVGRIMNRPGFIVGGLSFCPMCGSKASCERDLDEDYWETMATSYKLPVEILKQLYDIWNPREHPKFYSHVQEMLKEAGLVSA